MYTKKIYKQKYMCVVQVNPMLRIIKPDIFGPMGKTAYKSYQIMFFFFCFLWRLCLVEVIELESRMIQFIQNNKVYKYVYGKFLQNMKTQRVCVCHVK